MQGGFDELAAFLGVRVRELDLSELLAGVVEWHQTLMEADLAKNLRREYQRGREQMTPVLREMIERGQRVSAVDYNLALEQVPRLNESLDEILLEYDAILTPATTGEAPAGLASTGSPIFCTPWSLCGMPAISSRFWGSPSIHLVSLFSL